MVFVAESMQEQLTAHKTGKGNGENLRRTVDVLAVATTLIILTHYVGVIHKRGRFDWLMMPTQQAKGGLRSFFGRSKIIFSCSAVFPNSGRVFSFLIVT